MKSTKQKFLTPTEAAVVSCVSLRNVNRAFDEKILPENLYQVAQGGDRRLRWDACIFLAFYFEAANRLTAEERVRVIANAGEQLPLDKAGTVEGDWMIRQDFLTIDLAPFLRTVRQRMARLSAASNLVVEDAEILSGTPVIRGTRIPIYDVALLVASGEPIERILEDYPRLNRDQVELAQIFAEANPLRGRPRRSSSLPTGATIVSSRSVPTDRPMTQKLAS